MGSGEANIRSRRRVDDGQKHVISVERLGRSGSLTVDSGDTAYGDSPRLLQMLNADGNIYIGTYSRPLAKTKFTCSIHNKDHMHMKISNLGTHNDYRHIHVNHIPQHT